MKEFADVKEIPADGVCCVYMLQCRDGSLYTGWTNHLQDRIEAHNAGKGAKYTKGRRPVRCVYVETYASKEEAMSREFAVKRLVRAEKEKLIELSPDDHI